MELFLVESLAREFIRSPDSLQDRQPTANYKYFCMHATYLIVDMDSL